jgi:hypothetical protein
MNMLKYQTKKYIGLQRIVKLNLPQHLDLN